MVGTLLPNSGIEPSNRYLFDHFGRGLKSSSPFSTVHEAFLYHAELMPHAVAVQDKSTSPERVLTYEELAKYARFLAAKLVDLKIKADVKVPLVTRRSTEMIVGILGVLMAGGQYIPLDGGVVPDETLRYVFNSCEAETPVLVSRSTVMRKNQISVDRPVLILENVMSEARACWNDIPTATSSSTEDAQSGCYVIYTSGTTGTPKGVDVTHANVTNLVCQAPGNVGMERGLKVGSVLSISFDMGAWEILGALCNGATLVLRGSDWHDTLSEIDVLICTPTILSGFQPLEYPNIKFVATAGERLPQSIADRWVDAGKVLFTGCGPTEVTIVNTLHVHSPGSIVSIGRPTPNNNVYVLNDDREPLPIGDVGTLWAGGAGITRGYTDLPDTTAERWKKDPFTCDGSKMFDTGDLGYWLPDGTLQIVGRKDDQIKVKGFRVELDGISAVLASCPGVTAAVALYRNKQIQAFISPAECSTSATIDAVKSKLPYYAVPSICYSLCEFPRTPNGKIDKQRLGKMLDQQAVPVLPPEKSSSTTTLEVLTVDNLKNQIDNQPWVIEDKAVGENQLPFKIWPKLLRNLRLRIFIVYRTLFSLIWILNIAAIIIFILTDVNPQWIERMAYINLTLAVLVRQDHIINLLYSITCSLPRSWPLFIRKRAAKVYHLGGIHSGAASSAVVWFMASLVRSTIHYATQPSSPCLDRTLPGLLIAWITVILLVGILFAAYPEFRKKYHDMFEMVHRFIGWTSLVMIWIYTILSSKLSRCAASPGSLGRPTLGSLLASKPEFYLIITITTSIALSWLTLRRVGVDAEVLSSHAVRLHFSYAVPVNGSFVRLSIRPLLEWHSFATIGAPEPVNGRSKGFSLVVSNAGDWTKNLIGRPRTSIWVRGVPTCGVMRIATLFNRVVLVGTGSGIGPLLGFIERPSCSYRLIWSTKNPETTFGTELCKLIRNSDPNGIVHDTAIHGRPDLVAMTWREVQATNAEAVIVIANQKLTKKVVYGLESRGIPAYGAIWDS